VLGVAEYTRGEVVEGAEVGYDFVARTLHGWTHRYVDRECQYMLASNKMTVSEGM
jgi:putative N-acetylmannosamine-6-phosphate epimerase